MTGELLDANEAEAFKMLVHLGLLSLGVTCALYSVGAFMARPAKHLTVNATVYALLSAYEVAQIHKHWRSLCTKELE